MTARPIGYYVHHSGDGHRQRALAIAAQAGGRITLLGTGLAHRTGHVPAIDLPDDRPTNMAPTNKDSCPEALHYAPTDHGGVRARTAALSVWIATACPALIVTDVSIEIAMLARLASIPTVVVRLAGRRDDMPHMQAFCSARAVMAPFAEALDDPDVPVAIRARTTYCPGLTSRPPDVSIERDLVVVVLGRGASGTDGETWAAAARATPNRRWRVLGLCTAPMAPPSNLTFAGWVDDPGRHIAAAGVVIGGAGDGVTGAVFAAQRPFLCLPEERPFDEQQAKAQRMQTIGAAIVPSTLPTGNEWPRLLAEAEVMPLDMQAMLDDIDGPARTAAWLCAMADGHDTLQRRAS